MQKREKEKVERKRIRDGILRELPAFSGQLLLLLNSGMIFSDAFARIEDGYRKGRRQSPFAQEVIWIRRQAEETGKSLVAVMQTRAASLRLREFSRIAAMISDSQYKGVDLSDKLESERLLLWEQRKKLAEAKGKAAETKLAFPLALLLLVLILITAAPAILQM